MTFATGFAAGFLSGLVPTALTIAIIFSLLNKRRNQNKAEDANLRYLYSLRDTNSIKISTIQALQLNSLCEKMGVRVAGEDGLIGHDIEQLVAERAWAQEELNKVN